MTVAEVKTLALEDNNFDTTLLSRFILPAQRQYIKSFLSTDFYNELLDQIENTSLTPDNTTLLENFLKPALAYYTVCDAFHSIRIRIASKGIMINEADSSEAAERGDAATVRNHMQALGSRWLKDADEFIREAIEDDDTKYPLYLSDCRKPKIGKGKVSIYVPK